MKTLHIKIILLLTVILGGCEKDESRYLEGDIVGFVDLIDQYGNPMIDRSGVEVKIENSSFSGITEENGRYEIKNIKAGSYNIILEKEGFGSLKKYGYSFIGGNVPDLLQNLKLFEKPKIEILNTEITSSENMIYINCELTETKGYEVECYIGNDDKVSNENYILSSYRVSSYWHSINSFQTSVSLNGTSFQTGETIYLVIYFYNPAEYGYFDRELDKNVISSCIHSEVFTCTIE